MSTSVGNGRLMTLRLCIWSTMLNLMVKLPIFTIGLCIFLSFFSPHFQCYRPYSSNLSTDWWIGSNSRLCWPKSIFRYGQGKCLWFMLHRLKSILLWIYVLAGWGVANVDKKLMSPVLNQVQIPVITNELCKNNYIRIPWYETVIDYRVLCTLYAKNKPKDSCQGDSGGPVMLPIHQNGSFPFYQIAIISHSEGEFLEYLILNV